MSVRKMREDTARYGYEMDVHSQAFMTAWLASIK
jgi:hypothetical protein